MFLVEGGMSFDTRNAVAGARAFQRELKTTGKVAEETSKAGRNLEQNFSSLGSQKTRGALRGLQSALMGAKDGTDAAIAGAKALQIALVKSVAGTAIIGAAGVLSDSIRDVGSKIGAAADEASRAAKGFSGFAQSLDEGRQRADTLTQSADNTLKSLEAMKNAGIFQAGVFKLFGGEDVLKDLEETTRGLARAEFGAGAAAGRRTAERRVGMTPEQVAADIRKEEEQKRLREAETKGGAGARADVQRTIDAENEQKRREEGAKSQKAFEKDVASTQEKIAKIQEAQAKAVEQKRLDALVPAARIVELDKEAAKVVEKIAEITKTGIYGTEEARKKQLEEIVALEQRSVDLANEKTKALQEQKDEEQAVKKRAEDEATAKRNVEIEERKDPQKWTREDIQKGIEEANRLKGDARLNHPAVKEHLRRISEQIEKRFPGATITRGGKQSPWKDATPAGYGPTESTDSEESTKAGGQLTTEQQSYIRAINEGKTILKGNISEEKKSQVQRAIKSAENKLKDTGYEKPMDIDQPYKKKVLESLNPAELKMLIAGMMGGIELGKYDGIDFTPPQGAREAAKRALDVREGKPASQKGMTPVGIARARDLMNGVKLSPDTVRRMKAFFDRHEVDKKGATWDEQGKGWQAWNAWGGDAGYAWARKVVRQMEAKDKKLTKGK